jgi:hypothetical protein
MKRAKQILTALTALIIALAICLPCLHPLFARSVSAFYVNDGLSPKARALTAQQIQLWAKPWMTFVKVATGQRMWNS